MYRPEYGTSAGTNVRLRGPYNSTPVNNYLAGDGKSHVYMGPAYYVPSENRWIKFHEYRSLPRETRRDAILMESEEQWVAYQRKRDKATQPGGKARPINRTVGFITHIKNVIYMTKYHKNTQQKEQGITSNAVHQLGGGGGQIKFSIMIQRKYTNWKIL